MGQFFAQTGEELTLFVRHVAWLKSRPRKPKQEGEAPTRLAQIEDNGGQAVYPPIMHGQYLLDWLFEVGPVMLGGMAQAPLTFQEIESWARQTGRILSPWESQTMRALSQAFIAAGMEAEKPETPAPYDRQNEQFDREKISKKVGNLFKALARSK